MRRRSNYGKETICKISVMSVISENICSSETLNRNLLNKFQMHFFFLLNDICGSETGDLWSSEMLGKCGHKESIHYSNV